MENLFKEKVLERIFFEFKFQIEIKTKNNNN